MDGNALTWATVNRLAVAGDLDGITVLLTGVTGTDRFAAAAGIEAGIRSATTAHWWEAGPSGGRAPVNPAPGHALAVVACVRGAAQAAALLARLSARTSHHSWLEQLRKVGRSRETSWLADVGTRLARRLPVRNARPEDWSLAAALLHEADAGPPVTEAFARGWIRHLMSPERPGRGAASLADRLGEDRFLDRLLPAFFEIEGLGTDAAVTFRDPGVEHEDREPWFPAVVPVLLDRGRFDRATVLDATVSRLGHGGRPAGLRAFVLLHDALAPTIGELAVRVTDYARMLPDGPSTVAGLAQRAVRAVDEAGGLELDVLLEASGPVLVRPEKSLVKAQLIWLSRVAARHPDRIGEIVDTVAAAFGNPHSEIRQRALGLVTNHIGALSPTGVARLREAAAQLTGDLAERAADLFTDPDEPAPGAATPDEALASTPPTEVTGEGARREDPAGDPTDGFTPYGNPSSDATGTAAAMPEPIACPAELAGEVASLLVTETAAGWERVLAGLVSLHAAGHRRELAELLTPFLERYPHHFEHLIWIAQRPTVFLGVAIRRLSDPDDPGPAWDRMVEAVRTAEDTGQRGGPDSALARTPDGVLAARIAEAAIRFTDRPVPLLMATPTHLNGSLDAEVLLARLLRAETEGWQPWRLDLEQALLRVPRRVDPAVVTAAGRLTSPAGRLFAGWLAEGGLPDPVSVRVEQRPGGYHPTRVDLAATPVERVVADLRPARGGVLSLETQLVTVTRDPLPFRVSREPSGDIVGLAMVLPHHRDAVAAWLLSELAQAGATDERGSGSRLSLLADCTGPAGAATVLALVYGLTARHEADRAAAVDLFLALAAEDAQRPARGGPATAGTGPATAGAGPATAGTGPATAGTGPAAAKSGSATVMTGTRAAGGRSFAAAAGIELGRLGGLGDLVKVARSVPALADAHRAGVTGHVWELLGTALPHLLPVAPRGLPDMLALAAEVAHAAGARGEIPGLTEVANRRGSSRLITEARRLHDLLTR
ncbi:hypothetical protein AB0G04_22395 [Actinoplanes sp. NPDC023801]|uniref:hypothetical protein n=1 Tax=Actinoplanes sp. NPDC023801 TaxID=3154595 RepID=UPI0033CE75F1